MENTKKIIIDLDDTLTNYSDQLEYSAHTPRIEVIEQLKKFQKLGFMITIHTSRNMRTYSGNLGKINIHTLPAILAWLKVHDIPFDEVLVGKPWCGEGGFYVDDKAIRPSEFASLTIEQISEILMLRG